MPKNRCVLLFCLHIFATVLGVRGRSDLWRKLTNGDRGCHPSSLPPPTSSNPPTHTLPLSSHLSHHHHIRPLTSTSPSRCFLFNPLLPFHPTHTPHRPRPPPPSSPAHAPSSSFHPSFSSPLLHRSTHSHSLFFFTSPCVLFVCFCVFSCVSFS